jgi:hypothetical protein
VCAIIRTSINRSIKLTVVTEKEIFQTAAAVLYPTKIIIETRNIISQGSFYTTDDLSILPPNSRDEILGEVILEHLSRSRVVATHPSNYKEIRKAYLKKAKFRSEPAFRQDARYVSIFKTINTLRFQPLNNKLSEGRWGSFMGLPKAIFEIKAIETRDAIGEAIREAWTRCILS